MTGRRARSNWVQVTATGLLLTACNAGVSPVASLDDFPANPDTAPVDASFGVSASGKARLAFSGYRGDGTVVSSGDAGTITLPEGTIADGVLSGTLNASQTEIALAGGGTVALTNPAGTDYVRFFQASPAGSSPFSGVLGVRTDAADLPQSGRTAYFGRAEMTAADSEALYALDGAAEVRVDFDAARVTIRLTDLSGERRQGTDVRRSTVDSIVVSESVLAGGRFSGGTLSVTGVPFAVSDAADASGTEGYLYGAGADEAAGRVIVRDPGGDNVRILGRFAAD